MLLFRRMHANSSFFSSHEALLDNGRIMQEFPSSNAKLGSSTCHNNRTFWVVLGASILFISVTFWLYCFVVLSERTRVDDVEYSRNGVVAIHLGAPDTVNVHIDQNGGVKSRLDELHRIRVSVLNELRSMEQKRSSLREEIASQSLALTEVQRDITVNQQTLSQLMKSVEEAKRTLAEFQRQYNPPVRLPTKLHAHSHLENNLRSEGGHLGCNMENSFDYSRCSIVRSLTVFVYPISANPEILTNLNYDGIDTRYLTDNPNDACIFLVPLNSSTPLAVEQKLHTLPHWSNAGLNHVLLNSHTLTNTGSAIRVGSLLASSFRPDFDIFAPPVTLFNPTSVEPTWLSLPPLVPALRKFFLSFWGWFPGNETLSRSLLEVQQLATQTKELFYFAFSCDKTDANIDSTIKGWLLCGDEKARGDLLRNSTFSLVPAPMTNDAISMTVTVQRLIEGLKYGAIPVILGQDAKLPFSEVLDWNLAAIKVPYARLPELHFRLRAIADADLLELRRRGRLFYERHFSSDAARLNTLFAVLSYRLGMSLLPVESLKVPQIYNATHAPRTAEIPYIPETDEYLGPVELPNPSLEFSRNFTQLSLYAYSAWNMYGNALGMHPYTPFGHVLPSEAQYGGSGFGFRPINAGAGGSGKEFSESLGGNYPREQFTIVMLTYERDSVLLNSLLRLTGLPYLNKIVVVWNGRQKPSPELVWPKLTAPVVVIQPERNSLNNRFLPYDVIETEAVLSIDDDALLRHDEIILGFRAWREERDRIVGFPGRYHAWDAQHHSWLYNSNHSCELSMVLTGAAFFHKFYAYLYAYEMPQAIRDKVDQLMNCEDIAMNFLVSHVTRKPPLKVTSRWTFRCPGCPETLSADDTHFYERHECINVFTKIYGYNPLLYTQLRVDSILFKTRIPHTHQKCFKFV